MTQEKSNMPLFVIGGIMIVYALIVSTNALLPLMKYLHTHKTMDLQVTMGFICGGLAIFGAIVNIVRKPGNTVFDRFFLQPLPGILFLLLLAMVIRWYAEPLVKIISKQLVPVLGFKIYKVLNLNYVVLGLLAGVVITNTAGIPKFAAAGVKTARFVLKMGVIMLGARYSFAELAKLGVYSIWLIGFFVLGPVAA